MDDPDPSHALRELFAELCDLNAAEQERRLAEQSPRLASELRSLLEADSSTLGLSYPGLLEQAFTPPGPAVVAGQTLGRYQLVEVIGTGGMGQVWRATAHQGGSVALKLLRPELFSPRARKRFAREAAALQRVSHPNLVACLDAGEEEGVAYLVQELVPGAATLRDAIAKAGAEGELPRAALRDAAELVARLAAGLSEVHAAGIVHRDLKPENILVTRDGVPKVTDFGLALLEGEANLTRTGETPGTPRYMSPEQFRGDALGPATDIFSLGAILFELLTLRPVFDGASMPRIREQALHGEIPSARSFDRRIPLDLATICDKCLERTAGRRYASMDALGSDLRCFLRGLPIEARPPGLALRAARSVVRQRRTWVVTSAALITLTASGVFWYLANENERLSGQAAARAFASRIEDFRGAVDNLGARASVALRKMDSGGSDIDPEGNFERPTGLDQDRPDAQEHLAALEAVGIDLLGADDSLQTAVELVAGQAQSECFSALMLLAIELQSSATELAAHTARPAPGTVLAAQPFDPGPFMARLDAALASAVWHGSVRSIWTAWRSHWAGEAPDDPLALHAQPATVARFWWSELLRARGEHSQANELLLEALREDPTSFAGHYVLSRSLPASPGRTARERRISHASSAVVLRPSSSRAQYQLGTLLYSVEEDAARDAFDRARRLDPELSVAHSNYAVTVSGEAREAALEAALATRAPYLACYRIASAMHPNEQRRIEHGLAGLHVEGPLHEWGMLRVSLGQIVTGLLQREHTGHLRDDQRDAADLARQHLSTAIPWMGEVLEALDPEQHPVIVARAHQVRVLAAQLIDFRDYPGAPEASPEFVAVALPSARAAYALTPNKTHDVVTSLTSTLSFLSEYEEMYDLLNEHADMHHVRAWTRGLREAAESQAATDPELAAVAAELNAMISSWDEEYDQN